jgi:hypothetical protein
VGVGLYLALGIVAPSWFPTESGAWDDPRADICVVPEARNTDLSPADVRSIVDRALAEWLPPERGGNLACNGFDLGLDDGPCESESDGEDGRTNLYFEPEWRRGSATIGFTLSTVDTSRVCRRVTDDTGTERVIPCRVGSDIELNDEMVVWDRGGSLGVDLFTVVAHELGHLLGLGHCEENGTCGPREALMFGNYSAPLPGVLADDEEGVCALYPGSAGELGVACADGAACRSGLCSAAPVGVCTEPCAGGCPLDWTCADGRCLPPPLAACAPCLPGAGDRCGPGAGCFDLQDGLGPRCRPRCDGGCPDGTNCRLEGEIRSCVGACRSEAAAAVGEACLDRPCVAGAVCHGRCLLPCSDSCPAGEACTDRFGARVCLPERVETEACDSYTACAAGTCLALAGQAPQCVRTCSPGVCRDGQTCESISLRPGAARTVCQPALLPDDPAPTPDLGVVTPSDQGPDAGPTSDAEPGPPIEGACTCRSTGGLPGSVLWILAGAMGAMGARRRRD